MKLNPHSAYPTHVIGGTAAPRTSNYGSHTMSHTKSDREAIIRKAVSDLIYRRRVRAEHVITQEELAVRSGISYEHLNRIENYRAMPSIMVLDRIARSLGFDRLSDFLADDEFELL